MGILRLGHVDIRVPDLELATAYYTEVLGLLEVAREADRVYLKCWDEHDHHSVVLRYAPRYGLDHAMYKVEAPDDLDDLERKLSAYGCTVRRMSAGDELGMGQGSVLWIRPAEPSSLWPRLINLGQSTVSKSAGCCAWLRWSPSRSF